MKEIRKTFIAFTEEEQSVLEKARDICQTGSDFVDDLMIADLFNNLVMSFDELEKSTINQFEYDEHEVIGTYETEFMTDDTYSENVEYGENENE